MKIEGFVDRKIQFPFRLKVADSTSKIFYSQKNKLSQTIIIEQKCFFNFHTDCPRKTRTLIVQ